MVIIIIMHYIIHKSYARPMNTTIIIIILIIMTFYRSDPSIQLVLASVTPYFGSGFHSGGGGNACCVMGISLGAVAAQSVIEQNLFNR